MPSNIEWTDETWNPVTGCNKVSQGCKHCYAEREWDRLSANSKATAYAGRVFTDVRDHPERLAAPLRWTRPRKVFVNSMSDLFHETLPFEFIAAVFGAMALSPAHTFQVLTKRPRRMGEFFDWLEREGSRVGGPVPLCVTHWLHIAGADHGLKRAVDACLAAPPAWPLANLWLGVSVEDQAAANERVPLLLRTPAALHWVSAEPLLGPVDLGDWMIPEYPNCSGFTQSATMEDGYCSRCGGHVSDPVHASPLGTVKWVVAGGESGPKARPAHPGWARSLRDQCMRASVPFVWKQWGAWRPICQGGDAWERSLYRSNRVARSGENQDALDECYGRTCRVPQLCLHVDGEHVAMCEPNAFLQGTSPVQAFKVGKKAAGRLLDGVLHDAYPEQFNGMAGAIRTDSRCRADHGSTVA